VALVSLPDTPGDPSESQLLPSPDLKPTRLIELPFWQLTAALDGTPLALAHDPVALRSPMPAPCLLALAAAWWHWVGWLGCHGHWNMRLRAHSRECQGENHTGYWLVGCGNGIGPQHPSPLEAGLLRNDCLALVVKPRCHLIRIESQTANDMTSSAAADLCDCHGPSSCVLRSVSPLLLDLQSKKDKVFNDGTMRAMPEGLNKMIRVTPADTLRLPV
jgi:hypothetical protein